MSTGAESTNFVFKRLLASQDFKERLLEFLTNNQRDLAKRVFADDAIFDDRITMAGSGAGQLTLSQISPGEFKGTDGLGDMFDLGLSGNEDATVGQIKTFLFENANTISYFISLQKTTIPRGIQINPRTGFPEYAKNLDAVGVRAAPDSVVDNGGSLTLVINSVCEANHDHAGRTAMVFLKSPDKGGISEAIAIELVTVSFTGVDNRITTSGVLGQSAPSITANDYDVVLLGPTVRKFDTSIVSGHAFIASIVGNGGTPGAGDNTNQGLIDQSLTSLTGFPGTGPWNDGTTNPATTIIAQIAKIVLDLTSNVGARGLGKLTAPPRSDWDDGTANPGTRADLALDKIITDLGSPSGKRGAGKITTPQAVPWNDGFLENSGNLADQIDAIISSLGSQASPGGTDKIGSFEFTSDAITIATGSLRDQLIAIWDEVTDNTVGKANLDGLNTFIGNTDRNRFRGIVEHGQLFPTQSEAAQARVEYHIAAPATNEYTLVSKFVDGNTRFKFYSQSFDRIVIAFNCTWNDTLGANGQWVAGSGNKCYIFRLNFLNSNNATFELLEHEIVVAAESFDDVNAAGDWDNTYLQLDGAARFFFGVRSDGAIGIPTNAEVRAPKYRFDGTALQLDKMVPLAAGRAEDFHVVTGGGSKWKGAFDNWAIDDGSGSPDLFIPLQGLFFGSAQFIDFTVFFDSDESDTNHMTVSFGFIIPSSGSFSSVKTLSFSGTTSGIVNLSAGTFSHFSQPDIRTYYMVFRPASSLNNLWTLYGVSMKIDIGGSQIFP